MQSHLHVKTWSRVEFISLFAQIAECFPLSAFHNREDVPVIIIKGDVKSGKSLIAETMMKTWSDDHRVEDTLASEKDHMFLERYPREAMHQTLSRKFNVSGKKVVFSFNSHGMLWSPEEQIKDEIRKTKDVAGGAAFVSDMGIWGDDDTPGEWISVIVEFPGRTFKRPKDNPWARELAITASKERLIANPHFLDKWTALLARSGLASPALN